MNLFGSMERQSGNHHNLMKQGKEETKDERTFRELKTEPECHDHLIAKRVAYGNVSINSHGDQQNPL